MAEKEQELTQEPKLEQEQTSPEEATAKPAATTKAGKHSAKAIREAEELEAKQARKEAEVNDEPAPKPKMKPRVKTYSKKQKAARELVEKDKLYTIEEAVDLLPKLSQTSFDATAELHIALGIDPRQADQQFRNSVVLPAGTGSKVRIAVLADAKNSQAAADAGADVVDSEVVLADIAKGKFDFDVLVASPDQMAVLGRHAKVLGPKGLMPSPKSGTVTADPAKAVSEIKKGRLDLKNDANGIVHVAIGKVSFKPADLLDNAKAVLNTVMHNRPAGVKGVYVKSAYMAATMTPSIKLDTAGLSK